MNSPSPRASSDAELVDRLSREVQALRGQLGRAQRLAALGTMAAMVAHEFNNILTPMYNYAQLARNGDEPMREKAIRHACEGSSRAAAICHALLDLAGPGEARPRKLSVVAVVEEAVAAMARDPAKDGIHLILKVPARLKITTRSVELKQLLLNLLLNARAAVLQKGRGQSIAISALRRNGEVLIRVADTGVGIPPELRKRIFEPFFTTRDGDGTGLGLPVCRHIAEVLHGRLSVRSQQGKGSCFTVILPLNGKPAKSRRRPGKGGEQ